MHVPDVIFLNRQKKTSLQTHLGNESLAATEMYEPSHPGGRAEVNQLVAPGPKLQIFFLCTQVLLKGDSKPGRNSLQQSLRCGPQPGQDFNSAEQLAKMENKAMGMLAAI